MEDENRKTVFDALSMSLEHYLKLCHSEIEGVQFDATLPTESFAQLQSAKLCTVYIKRVIGMLGIWFDGRGAVRDDKIVCLNMRDALLAICNYIAEIIPSLNITAEFNANLSPNSVAEVNREAFDFIILSVLYCSIRNVCAKEKTKIVIRLSETESQMHISIRDNCAKFKPFLSDNPIAELSKKSDSEAEIEAAIQLNFEIAKKYAAELGGNVKHTATKNGNRYDIFIPKQTDDGRSRVMSPDKYTPSQQVFQKMFSDVLVDLAAKESAQK